MKKKNIFTRSHLNDNHCLKARTLNQTKRIKLILKIKVESWFKCQFKHTKADKILTPKHFK